MDKKLPKVAIFVLHLMVPKFKKSMRQNIQKAAVFCEANVPEETDMEIRNVEEKLARLNERVAALPAISEPALDKIIAKVEKYGKKCVAKIIEKHEAKLNFKPETFERLALAKINVAKASIPEKIFLVNASREKSMAAKAQK